jgi:Rac GTPase-activating protein 1
LKSALNLLAIKIKLNIFSLHNFLIPYSLFQERFLRGKGAPDLSQTDIHTICGTLKDFLRSLKEPLITQSQWKDFTRACEHRDPAEVKAALYTAIAELPQPNRDTLAYLIMHLQRVAEWDECKMPINNLAKVFGPTIVGYSTEDMDAMRMVSETRMQQNVIIFCIVN